MAVKDAVSGRGSKTRWVNSEEPPERVSSFNMQNSRLQTPGACGRSRTLTPRLCIGVCGGQEEEEEEGGDGGVLELVISVR